MCRSTGELAASTCAKRVKSRGEAGFLRMATAIRGMPGSEFEPRRPLQKHHPIGWCFFVCASALTVVSAGCRRLPQPTAGTLPRKRLASSATGGASALSSSPAPKRIPHPKGWGFVFGKPRAGLNSLPRPARSASNSEVRQDTGDPCVKETLRRSMYVVENGRHCVHVTYKRVLEKIRKSL